jgi:hypothetical protein
MRKVLLLAIPLIVMMALGFTFTLINVNQPQAWQGELDRYLRYKNASPSAKYEMKAVVKASKPWNLSADMSKATFGESVYYQTDYRYSVELPHQDTLGLIAGNHPNGSLMPLPYPPEKAWCVFGESRINPDNSPDGAETTSLVLIGLHQDLYNADIIIHETYAGSQDQVIEKILESIGCEFP